MCTKQKCKVRLNCQETKTQAFIYPGLIPNAWRAYFCRTSETLDGGSNSHNTKGKNLPLQVGRKSYRTRRKPPVTASLPAECFGQTDRLLPPLLLPIGAEEWLCCGSLGSSTLSYLFQFLTFLSLLPPSTRPLLLLL
jgi:hypothetical protein